MGATTAFSALVSLQLLTRATNFALTAALARTLGPAAIGLANVQLQLVSASGTFLAKEGVRRACQRLYPGGAGASLAHAVNLSWLSVPLTLLCACAVGFSSARRGLGDADALITHAEYARTLWLFCAAAVVEACAEPAWLYAQANGLIPTRVVAEGCALLLKAAATAYLVLGTDGTDGTALAFGYAQLLYACAYLLLLCGLLRRQMGNRLVATLGPRRAASPGASTAEWLPLTHRSAGVQYCWQSIQKYGLTEGERLVLVGWASLHDQGVFALVSNLGSLVARLLLQPVEEIVFAHYSQLAAAARQDGSSSGGGGLRMSDLERIHALLRAAAIFGGVFVAFGPAYSWLLLRLLYGTRWAGSAAPFLLGVYCVHVCLMAVNGVGEAYVNATASPTQLAALSKWMVVLACIYLPVAAFALRELGAPGLVLANALNMGARIAYAYATLRADAAASAGRRAGAAPRLLPEWRVLLALALSASLTLLGGRALGLPAERSPAQHAGHVAVGCGCLLVVAYAVRRLEPELLDAVRTARREAREAKSK